MLILVYIFKYGYIYPNMKKKVIKVLGIARGNTVRSSNC